MEHRCRVAPERGSHTTWLLQKVERKDDVTTSATMGQCDIFHHAKKVTEGHSSFYRNMFDVTHLSKLNLNQLT